MVHHSLYELQLFLVLVITVCSFMFVASLAAGSVSGSSMLMRAQVLGVTTGYA
jgi:hypothetical protein